MKTNLGNHSEALVSHHSAAYPTPTPAPTGIPFPVTVLLDQVEGHVSQHRTVPWLTNPSALQTISAAIIPMHLLKRNEAPIRACLRRWGCFISSPIVLIIIVVVAAVFLSSRNNDPAKLAAPLPGFPDKPESIKDPNPWRVGADLDGVAVVFAEEAVRLIGADGEFHKDLPVDEYATRLVIDIKSISTPDGRLNPDAVLFQAQRAVLTANGRAQSLEMRKHQIHTRDIPWAVYAEWERRDFAFTLNKLLHPNDDEIIILAAISNAPPRGVARPGDKIRATGINRRQFENVPVISGGMLPLEALPGTGKE